MMQNNLKCLFWLAVNIFIEFFFMLTGTKVYFPQLGLFVFIKMNIARLGTCRFIFHIFGQTLGQLLGQILCDSVEHGLFLLNFLFRWNNMKNEKWKRKCIDVVLYLSKTGCTGK